MKKFGMVLASSLLILSSWLVASCSKEPEKAAVVKVGKNEPLMSAKNIDVLFSDLGRIQARLTAPLMNRYGGDQPQLEFPNGFSISIYDSVLNTSTTITGNRGVRHELKRVMEAWGNVVIHNLKKKEQLNTEHILWDETKHRIWADGKVKITTPDKILYGSQMESDEAFTDYTISNVTGQMKINRDSL